MTEQWLEFSISIIDFTHCDENVCGLMSISYSFPHSQASFSKNCSLLRTDNAHGQISEHIFSPNEGYNLNIRIIL